MTTQPPIRVLRLILLFWLLLMMAGCASIQHPHRAHLQSNDAEIRACAEYLKALDRATVKAGVTDIDARRVEGFPYLRVDRFLAALREEASGDPAMREAWSRQLLNRDSQGREVEIANLPVAEVETLATDRMALQARVQTCAERLARADLVDDAAVDLLEQRAVVEDDYSTGKRALGLYALTRYPFFHGVENWQREAAETIKAARSGETSGHPVTHYQPGSSQVYTRREVSAILARAANHPLGIVELSRAEQQRLFATYAPIFEIETVGDYDRIGQLYWSGHQAPQVDVTRPVVYTRLDYTRIDGRNLVQLVYVAWLPARPRQHAFDLLGGHLDGLVWRVTLAPDAEPVLFDSIHPCGCYHMFFPTPRMQPLPAPSETLEWAFIPATLPDIEPGQRLTLSLQTRTHYLRNVWPAQAETGVSYQLVDYDRLRSLPLAGGGHRSIFGPDGLVAGSERRERFLFWPMGIKSAGAMRQAGSQATAFVGRRHFDDADLIAKRFRLLD